MCPLIEESEDIDLANAEERFRLLSARFPGKVGLLHGRLKGAEREATMAAFAEGRLSILVATTVIEVGVDVPAATVMVIEHAERFGLAQLHQLRGRVGRGAAKSTCLLLYAQPLGETAKARLAIMRETEDGFRIAEEDLRLRGAGELLGTRQSGLPDMRLADLAAHAELLQAARDDARLVDRARSRPAVRARRGAARPALPVPPRRRRQDLARRLERPRHLIAVGAHGMLVRRGRQAFCSNVTSFPLVAGRVARFPPVPANGRIVGWRPGICRPVLTPAVAQPEDAGADVGRMMHGLGERPLLALARYAHLLISGHRAARTPAPRLRLCSSETASILLAS